MPKISVIMAAYNQAPYIAASVQSILNQTCTDFELIIIDDASTDATPEIIAGFDDPRITFLRNEQNGGSSIARNRGLEAASGAYIAIADGDDIHLPERLEKQVAFLESHPEAGVLGTQYRTINARGKATNKAYPMPTSHNLIVWALFTGYAIAHTSAMIRTNAWDVAGRHYHPSLPTSEDLELWLRMLHVTRFANLAEVLVLYRQWPQSQSIGNAQVQRQSSMGTFSKAASDLLEKPVPGELRLHVNILYLRDHLLSEQEASRAIKFLLELYPALHKAKLIDSGALDEVMIERIKTIARHSRPLLLRTVITLARVHTPLWLRRLWVRVRGFST